MSVIIGITGATSTPVGTPASRNADSIFNRVCGAAARGSSFDDSVLSSEVIDTNTLTNPCFASSASRSRSRRSALPLVTMLSGCRVSSKTSRQARLIPWRRSIGCQPSVLMPSAIGAGT